MAALRLQGRRFSPVATSPRRRYSGTPPTKPPSSASPSEPPKTKLPETEPKPEPKSEAETEAHRSTDPAVPNRQPEDDLPSRADSRRSMITAAIQSFMDNAQRTATETSNWASNATGTSYRAIDRLKSQNVELELELVRARESLASKRKEYQEVVQLRLHTQREVNTLLARKDSWTPSDLERFTTLYRDDHTLDSSVAVAGRELAAAEQQTEKLRERLVAGILGRYHEEQIWSDRIRRLSTWGTWGLMGVNVLLFLLFQFGAEPWRRARLTKGFEDKVAEGVKKVLVEERERAAVSVLLGTPSVAASEPAAMPAAAKDEESIPVVEDVVSENKKEDKPQPIAEVEEEVTLEPEPSQPETLAEAWRRRRDLALNPRQWKLVMADLASDRVISMRIRDASILVVEGAAAGACFAAACIVLVLKPSK